jgi:hypothetical protein
MIAIKDIKQSVRNIFIGGLKFKLLEVRYIAVVRACMCEKDGAGCRWLNFVLDGGFAVDDITIVYVFVELVLVVFCFAYLHTRFVSITSIDL